MMNEERDFVADMLAITTAVSKGNSLPPVQAKILFGLYASAVRASLLESPEATTAREWGLHPDEAKPRGQTWLHERRNWEEEVQQLRNAVTHECKRAEENALRVIEVEEMYQNAKDDNDRADAFEEEMEKEKEVNQRYKSLIDDIIREIEKKGDYEWARNIRCDLWFIDTPD